MASVQTIEICRKKLLEKKTELLQRIYESRQNYLERDKGSDEGDHSVANVEENLFLNSIGLLRQQLYEVELALARIERGTYGVCEETEEPIEEDRLMAIPWTRLSIEGAELQETMKKRFANNGT